LRTTIAQPAATWSGYRKSGMGQNHGTPGLREMSRQRFVSFDPAANDAPLFSFPYDDVGEELAKAALDHLHAPSGWRRLASLGRLLRIKRFRDRVPARSVVLSKKHPTR